VGWPHVEIEPPPEAPESAPSAADKGGCGTVTVAGSTFELDCLDDGYDKLEGAATALVGMDDLLAGGAMAHALPDEVDHRFDHTEGPVMHQGRTLACTSFSLASAVDHALARYLGRPGDVSPMHAWARYHKPNMALADRFNIGHGLAARSDVGWDEPLARRWQDGSATPDPRFLSQADNEAIADIAHITALTRFPAELKSTLAGGQDVWVTIKAAHYLGKLSGKQGALVVPDYDYRRTPKGAKLGHAVVLAGYRDTKSGTYYLIHNSWGDKWGDGGYAYIHERTLVRNLDAAYVVEAHPHDAKRALRAPAYHPWVRCDAGLVPDSETGQCVPPCTDGSPRHNGVCAVAGHCPPGQVNLWGRCTVAAPRYRGTVRGIKMACAPAGCTYEIPSGTAGCAEPGFCSVSCAAPRFRLGHGPRGPVCME
jgi:hypothetical protein